MQRTAIPRKQDCVQYAQKEAAADLWRDTSTVSGFLQSKSRHIRALLSTRNVSSLAVYESWLSLWLNAKHRLWVPSYHTYTTGKHSKEKDPLAAVSWTNSVQHHYCVQHTWERIHERRWQAGNVVLEDVNR